MIVAVSQAVNDVENIAVAIATVAGALAAVLVPLSIWLRRTIARVIDDRLQPMHDRLTQHLDEEGDQMKVVGAQLEIIAEHTGAKIPSALKLR